MVLLNEVYIGCHQKFLFLGGALAMSLCVRDVESRVERNQKLTDKVFYCRVNYSLKCYQGHHLSDRKKKKKTFERP